MLVGEPMGLEIEVRVRWFMTTDLDGVMRVEEQSFHDGMDRTKMKKLLRKSSCLVAQLDNEIVGFLIYTDDESDLYVTNMAVRPEYRRYRIGTQLMERLLRHLQREDRHRITTDILEHNETMQYFLRSAGFRATRTKWITDTDGHRYESYFFERCASGCPTGVEVLREILEGEGRTVCDAARM